jgi:hypothetical protein
MFTTKDIDFQSKSKSNERYSHSFQRYIIHITDIAKDFIPTSTTHK